MNRFRRLLLVVASLLASHAAIAQTILTIDALGNGTALSGSELFPLFQGSNPAVHLAATVLKTYFTSGLCSTSGCTSTANPFLITGLGATQGGAINLTGGTSSGSANAGGALNFLGGTPGAGGVGGAVNITGGPGDAANAIGGALTFTGGAGGGTAAGASAQLIGGASGSGATGNGGQATLRGGTAVSTNGTGGNARVVASPGSGTGAGGIGSVAGGIGGNTSGNGGIGQVSGGASGTGSTGNGGAANILGGNAASTNGTGGLAAVAGGTGTGTGNGGFAGFTGGVGGATSGTGGGATVAGGTSGAGTTGAGGAAALAGGAAISTNGAGGAVAVSGGAGTGTGNGGGVTISGGAAGGSGTPGTITLESPVVASGLGAGTQVSCLGLTSGNAMVPATGACIIPGAAASYLGYVSTRTMLPNVNGTASNAQGMSRSTHFARSNITSLQVIFAGFYYPSGVETPNGAATTVTASVEYPVGTITRITFSSSNTGSIASGTYLVSDPVAVTIPYGAMFFIREWESNVNGIIYTNNEGPPASILMATDGYQFGATTPDLTGGGSVASPGFQGMHFPIGIIAQTTRPSVCLFGDSRIQGYADTMDSFGDIGEFARSVGPNMAYANFGVGEDTAVGASTTFANRLALSAYCSHILLNYGINDVISEGRTAAQLVTNMNTIIGLFPAGKEIWAATLPPVTTSTDSWATTANQTTSANNSVRVTYNTDVRAGSSLVGIRGYIEMAGVVESGLNSGLWAAPGYTFDGTHEARLATTKEQASGIIPVWNFGL